MITIKDINKHVFLRIENAITHEHTWENEGCIFKGILKDGSRLVIEMPDGDLWQLNPEVVRILEPRPGIK